MTPFDTPPTTSYWRSIVFHNGCHVFFCNIQCWKISQSWKPGQGSIKVIESGTICQIEYGFLLVFYSNFVPKMQFLRYPTCKYRVTLKPRVRVTQGHRKWYHSIWKWYHSIPMTSYWHSIVPYLVSFLRYSVILMQICNFLPPLLYLTDAPWCRTPSKFPNYLWCGKTRMMGQPDGHRSFKIDLDI